MRIHSDNSTCAIIEPLLEAFYDGALDPDRARLVSEHLAGCAACAARVRQYAEVDQLLRAAPMPTPGPALRQRVYGAIAAAQASGAPVAVAPPPAGPDRAQRQAVTQPPRDFAPTGVPAPHPRRTRGWLGGLAIAAVALALVVVFVSLGRGQAGPVHPGATATATNPTTASATAVPGATLPAFSDWRAAYLDDFGNLHVVSLDGKTDLPLSGVSALAQHNNGVSMSNNQVYHFGVSPDGHVLAFLSGVKEGTLELLTFTPSQGAQATLTNVAITTSSFLWSPDGAWLAAGGTFNHMPGLYRINSRTATPTLVPGTQAGGPDGYDTSQSVTGWIDATHLLIYTPPGGPHPLVSINVLTGEELPIAIPVNWFPTLIVHNTDPYALIVPNKSQCCPPATGSALLDLKTDQVTQLPNITHTLGEILIPAVGNPASSTPILASAPGVLEDARAQLYLADLLADSATPIATGVVPLGWTPDGKTLLVAQTASANGGLPGHAAYALTPPAAGATPLVIAQKLQTFIGFVRTA